MLANRTSTSIRIAPVHIDTYSLAQRPTLAHSHLITLFHTKRWTDMRSQVLMPLLISRVLWDEVEVFAADDECAVHLGTDDGAG